MLHVSWQRGRRTLVAELSSINSFSFVDNAISVCNFFTHVMGCPPSKMTDPVWERT